MTPAANEIFYFVRTTSTKRFIKNETMALSFIEQTENGALSFRRVDWTQLTLNRSRFINPDFILSLSLIGGSGCIGLEIVKSLKDLQNGNFDFHDSKFEMVDQATHAAKRKEIIEKALRADAEQQKLQEVAA